MVHMDRGARLAARRRFAKQAVAFEENRMVSAVEMELEWRSGVKQRLTAAIAEHDAVRLRDLLAEVDATEEQRTVHLQHVCCAHSPLPTPAACLLAMSC